eukprot:TRINITY_DN36989_c0_g1_i2.p1 TRINITY_DN36989_c0_g1~~TRINITY_DN36989_c0_g1_i2.p1  ORF type:complete len:243 (+),score=66.74 TRINITY_DN36989_c0_g1_i2:304-1032(+)
MFYPSYATNLIVRGLHNAMPSDREAFFLSTLASRRRLERKWQETPIAKAFVVPDEWITLKQQAQSIFMYEAIMRRGLTLYEAFVTVDADDNGVLSAAELYGALLWLGAPEVTPDGVLDLLEVADTDRDGSISWNEFSTLLEPDLFEKPEEDDVNEEPESVKKVLPSKVEPHGHEILRELLHERKRTELAAKASEKARREAYGVALDAKIYQDELLTRAGCPTGANPALRANTVAGFLSLIHI